MINIIKYQDIPNTLDVTPAVTPVIPPTTR